MILLIEWLQDEGWGRAMLTGTYAMLTGTYLHG